MTKPRVLVVRSGARSLRDFADAARVELVELVSHTIEPVDPDRGALESAADLAIVTSQLAVAEGLGGAAGEALRRRLGTVRLVAVGEGTAAALRSAGFEPHRVAEGSSEAVLAALPGSLAGVRVLLPCGEDASMVLAEALASRGAVVTRCVLYRKVARPLDPSLEADVVGRPFAAFCATSPSAARWLLESAGARGREGLRSTPAVALGPSTRAFLLDEGIRRVEVAAEARYAEAMRLLEALADSATPK